LISYHKPSREGKLSIMKNIQQYKIYILSQSVPRRRALNHEKYPTIKNWYLITIRLAKASSQSWKISNNKKLISYHNLSHEGKLSIMKISNNKKLISYHNPSREGELSIMKNIQQYKIDILSESVPRRRALNHETYPTLKNWSLITICPAKASS